MLASSREGKSAIRRWAAAEPTLRGLPTLDDLLAALRGFVDPTWRDGRLLAVLRLAHRDPAARRVALQVVRPALSNLARTYRGRWGPDASSVVVMVALERIANFPTDRRHTNLAGQITRDVRHVLHDQLKRELAFEAVFSVRTSYPDTGGATTADGRSAAERVLGIVADAVRSRKITREQAELVVASRLCGVCVEEIATAWRRNPQTVRRMRQRAERALIGVAVA